MTLSDIQRTHDRLEAMKSTQSVKIVNELKSEAHKHRGILLNELKAQSVLIAQLRSENAKLKLEIEEIWGVPEAIIPSSVNGPDSEP